MIHPIKYHCKQLHNFGLETYFNDAYEFIYDAQRYLIVKKCCKFCLQIYPPPMMEERKQLSEQSINIKYLILINMILMIRYHLKSLSFFSTTQAIVRDNYRTARQRLIKFPYSNILKQMFNYRFDNVDNDDFLHSIIIKDSVAFGSLRQFNNNFLIANFQYLFKEEPKINKLDGNFIFSKYFKQSLEKIKNVVIHSKNNQEISYNLKILFYLKQIINSQVDWSQFNFQQIQKSNILQHKAYLLQIYENQPKFLPFLQKFVYELNNQNKENQVKAALVLISIKDFHQKIPQNVSQLCIERLCEKIQFMNEWEHYRVIEYIFNTNYPITKNYVENLTKYVLKKYKQECHEQYSQLSVPLTTKILKLRQKLAMDNSELEKITSNNPLKFKNIFFQPQKKKLPILKSMISNDNKKFLPKEVHDNLSKYIFDLFDQITDTNKCEDVVLIQAVKLCLKYFNNFRVDQINTLSKKLEEQLLPMFSDADEVAYWLLILLLRLNKNKISNESVKSIANRLLKQTGRIYEDSNEQLTKRNCLQKIIELYYHFLRTQQTMENPEQLLRYDFKLIHSFPAITNANFVISKINFPPSEKFKLFQRMIPTIQNFLDIQKFSSIRSFFLLLNALHNSKCEQSKNYKQIAYLYQKIETFLIQYYTNHQPTNQQLLYIKKVFTQGRGNENQNIIYNHAFMKFIDECIKTPQALKKHHNEYMNMKKDSGKK